jgi:hypothetical protein
MWVFTKHGSSVRYARGRVGQARPADLLGCPGAAYDHALHEVWSVMNKLQKLKAGTAELHRMLHKFHLDDADDTDANGPEL